MNLNAEYGTAADLDDVRPISSKATKPADRKGIVTAAELARMVFPPIKWIVPGILPEGATILAGRPKLGKSWLAFDIALAVARGTYCLGDIRCEQGDVLYLGLEDNLRRLQGRMRKMSPPLSAAAFPERLDIATAWRRCDDGGLAAIEAWIMSKTNPRLIVVDVLAQFRSGRGNNDTLYESDYAAVSGSQELAGRHGIGILIIHHVRKGSGDIDPFERVSGTMGLTGAADTTMVLDRDGNGCSLYARGRDIAEYEKAVTFSRESCRWTIQGEAAEVRRTDERAQIMEALQDSTDPLSPADIAGLTAMKSVNVRKLLGKMAAAGEVVKAKYGRYTAVPPGHTDHTGHSSEDEV